jgi:hypothetical protein
MSHTFSTDLSYSAHHAHLAEQRRRAARKRFIRIARRPR